MADLNTALGGSTAHEAIDVYGVDLRSTGDASQDSLTFEYSLERAHDASVWVTCSVYARRPDEVGTTAKPRLDCMGQTATMDIPKGDQKWYRLVVTVRVPNSTKIPFGMRVFGSGQKTGGDPTFVRYALPKLEYGRFPTEWNASSGNALPPGMIAFFPGPFCPPGWGEYTPLRGRVAVGNPSGGVVGTTVGSALGQAGKHMITDVPAHTHDVNPPNTGTTSNGSHAHSANPPNTTSTTDGNHAHSVNPPNTGSTGAGDHSHSGTTAKGNSFGYRTVDNCGGTESAGDHIRGWGGCGFKDRNDANYALANHTHNFSTNTTGNHSHNVDIGAFDSAAAGNHTHNVDIAPFDTAAAGAHGHDVDIATFKSASTGSAEVDVTMPYLQLMACRKL